MLEGNTKGYRNHSQLLRFRSSEDPLGLINLYLSFVLQEAGRRGYSFSQEKVDWDCCQDCRFSIKVPRGQLDFERDHLLSKLRLRDLPRYELLVMQPQLELHPVFVLVEGEVEEWEKRG